MLKHTPADSYPAQKPHRAMAQSSAKAFDEARKDWLNPLAMQMLKDAVAKRAKRVVLNGLEFEVEYGHRFRSEFQDDTECVLLRRKDGSFAPRGYVSLRRLRAFEFGAEE